MAECPDTHVAVGGHRLARTDDEPVADPRAASTGSRRSVPSVVEHATSLAPTAASERSAFPVRRFDDASKYRPAKRNVVTPAATSR